MPLRHNRCFLWRYLTKLYSIQPSCLHFVLLPAAGFHPEVDRPVATCHWSGVGAGDAGGGAVHHTCLYSPRGHFAGAVAIHDAYVAVNALLMQHFHMRFPVWYYVRKEETMFLNRTNELADLEARYQSARAEFVVLWGRRRVGKTSLIWAFCQGKPHLFYFSERASAEYLLREF